MSKRSHSSSYTNDPMSLQQSSAAASAATSASEAEENAAKRPKFEDLVSEMSSEYKGKQGSASAIPSASSSDEYLDGGEDDEEMPSARAMTAEEEMDAILQLVDEAPAVAELDMEGARSLLSKFHKAFTKNQEHRAKWPDTPEKFMESELALDQATTALNALSVNQAFYPLLIEPIGGETPMENLCSLLLTHENIDMAIDALRVLHEMVDAEELAAADENVEPFIQLVTGKTSAVFLTSLVSSLSRFTSELSSKDQSDAVNQILSILENLTDLEPTGVCERLIQHTTIMDWILNRLKDDVFNQNKLYASEILAILFTSSTGSAQAQLSKLEGGLGMKSIVRFLARYRKEDPSNDEEIEYVENLFDVLCLALLNSSENQNKFRESDGIQLMLTLIRRNTYAKMAAYKALDYALSGCTANCELFIDMGGLKTLFSSFMANPSNKRERSEQTNTERHLLEIIAQLFLECTDIRYLRLRSKFEELDWVKTERTVELLTKYQTRVEDAERKYRIDHPQAATASSSSSSALSDDAIEEYSRKTENGWTHVELACITLSFLATAGEQPLRARLDQLLNQQDLSIMDLVQTLELYLKMMGEDETTFSESMKKKKQILQALAGMLREEEEAAAAKFD